MEEWLNGRTDCCLKMWWKDVGKKKGRMEKSGVTYDSLRLSLAQGLVKSGFTENISAMVPSTLWEMNNAVEPDTFPHQQQQQ